MRKSVASLGLCFLLVHAGDAFGQSKSFSPGFSETESRRRANTPRRKIVRSMSAERMIQQRAIRLAEQRRSRIEARRWRGISMMRPTRPNAGDEFYGRHFMDGPAWWAWIPKNYGAYSRR